MTKILTFINVNIISSLEYANAIKKAKEVFNFIDDNWREISRIIEGDEDYEEDEDE